jgi:hypothetical protein
MVTAGALLLVLPPRMGKPQSSYSAKAGYFLMQSTAQAIPDVTARSQ